MNTQINKKISQFLDDDLVASELENLLKTIEQDPELKNKLDRYQAVSHALKTDFFVMPKESFLDEIKQQVQQAPHYLVSQQIVKKRQFPIWQKTSLAVAASTALVAILIYQQTSVQTIEAVQTVALTTENPQKIVLAKKQKQQNVTLVAQKQAAEVMLLSANKSSHTQHERLKAYLQAHSDDLYTHGSLNYHPLGQVASYQE